MRQRHSTLRQVLRRSTPAELLADPIGRFSVGRRSCVFCHSPGLLGFASWGRPDVEDVRELLRLCQVGLNPGMVPYRWLVDLRGLELIEPATFGQFVAYTNTHREVLARNIVRQAQLRPDGLVGAVLSGFAQIARLSYPDRVFGEIEEALAWLNVERREGVTLLAELEAIRDEVGKGYPIVRKLRHELESAGSLVVTEVARRLGLSTRSLQRALREAGTTYRMELKAFRTRRAQELLRGERNLAWIAGEVGFSTTQHFATAYRHATGETPTEWRARQRESKVS
jgi:AraC-like DNA-binding protein